MRKRHTIIAPQLSPVHFSLVEAAVRASGHQFKVLRSVSGEDVELGLRHVNNDSCYPAIMVVGQLVNEFASGRADPAATSIMITQTGGMCRATNYVGLLRKALAEAGYPGVPVIAVSTQSLEANPGFKLTPLLAHRCMRAIALGDLLEAGLLRVRPYEAQPGAALAAYQELDGLCRDFFTSWSSGYGALVRRIVRTYDAVPRLEGERKPQVGIVGEILVKFHPDANNHVVDVVEAEGFEARLPGLMEFVLNGMHTAEWNLAKLGVGSDRSVRTKRLGRWWVDRYRAPVRRALGRAGLDYPGPGDVAAMARAASQICSLGNQAGEGWLLTAEILELIESGVKSIICAQPFACLPNHVTGKGMFREIMRRHPDVNIVTIEYDPGASPVNQLNRIKLLLAASRLPAAPAGGVMAAAASGPILPDPVGA
jgi:predicted nucleotide-binding protein (sugar kinase/HSP70/actin superfamily)